MTDLANMAKTVILSMQETKELLSMSQALEKVEHAFKLQAEGKFVMPPKLYLNLPEFHGDFRAMPAYINGCVGIKWVSVYPNNRSRDLPSVMAIIILCDPNTGCPIAIMDGTYITNMRTGAAGGIGAKYLARKDSSVIGLIGAGKQSETQLLAMNKVMPRIKEVKVFDECAEMRSQYVNMMGATLGMNIHAVETIEEATRADIVITTTPSTEPIVRRQHIRPGTHINAIGADAKGKQELEVQLLKSAKLFVDDIEQACHSGEINVPLSQGMITVEKIHGTLGEVVANMKKGRENDEEITIFDSTGLAIHDIVCAELVYRNAKLESQ